MNPYQPKHLKRVLERVRSLREDALALEREHHAQLAQITPTYRRSARNLLHYLAVRRHDLRALQRDLQILGLSSLGRLEGRVMPVLNAVLIALCRLNAQPVPAEFEQELEIDLGERLLRDHAIHILGEARKERDVRIMVTMPEHAATDASFVERLLSEGMDVMRINCAHDNGAVWAQMLEHTHRAEDRLGQRCRVAFDLAGPKLRTAAIKPGPEVLKWRPRRDVFGRTKTPAQVFLGLEAGKAPAGAVFVPINAALLGSCQPSDVIQFRDARDRARELVIVATTEFGCLCEAHRTSYVTSGTPLQLWREETLIDDGEIGTLPATEQAIELSVGDWLTLTEDNILGEPASTTSGKHKTAHIGCTLPQVFEDARPGERILFDDGKLEGVIRKTGKHKLELEITHAARGKVRLRAEKGINLPDTIQHLDRLNAQNLGIILKIENRQAFEALPELLLAALRHPPVAVMIARGDLGVEVGFERLAEVQEEILWLSEAAHVPVIWATQVLETLAKNGLPTRAEVTDAAMAGRAECVMLNKGPYIESAISFLDDVLKRMQQHQSKKTAILRRLKVSGQQKSRAAKA
jgi:pyruvate kinase